MKRPLSFLIALLIGLVTLSACQNSGDQKGDSQFTPPPQAGSQSEGGAEEGLTIRLAGSDWGYPQPYTHDPRGPGSYNMFLIFDSLLEKDEKGLIPWLASQYSISPDGKTYNFKLQEGVKWHDGEPFTANDVKFTFEYFAKRKPVRNDLFVKGKPFIESVEVVSDHELNVTVKEINATLLEKIGTCRIIPEHVWKDVENPGEFTDAKSVIGTGPYTLAEYVKEQGAYKFVAFPDFWGPKQRVKAIEHVPVSDRVLAFENGEIDYAQISPDVVPRFEGKQEYKIDVDPPYNGSRMLFNMTGPLADKSLRLAIAHAVNQEEIVKSAARGAGVPGNAGYVPDTHPFVNDNAPSYGYDPDKAKELLGGQTYSFKLRASEVDVRVAELVKVYLEAVGIEAEIEAADLKTVDQYVLNGDYELIIQSVGAYGGDPDYLREIFHTKDASSSLFASVLPGYSNHEIDELADRQVSEMDPARRKDMIFQLQEMIAEDLPIFTVYNKTAFNVHRPGYYDGWMYMYDHQWAYHSKLSYLTR